MSPIRSRTSVGMRGRVGEGIVKVVLLFIVFIFAAGFSFAAWSLMSQSVQLVKNGIPTEGKVISLSSEMNRKKQMRYVPIIEYTDSQGEKRVFSPSMENSKQMFDIGQTVPLLVPPNGNHPEIQSFMYLWVGGIVTSLFALIPVSIFCISIYLMVKNRRMKKLLMTHGTPIKATVLSVNTSAYSTSTNETYTWIIQAQWQNPRNNKVYVFESEEIPFNPKQYIKETIDVRILPDDPRVYEMDMSTVPEVGN